jgi:hypothetical protein
MMSVLYYSRMFIACWMKQQSARGHVSALVIIVIISLSFIKLFKLSTIYCHSKLHIVCNFNQVIIDFKYTSCRSDYIIN